MMSGHSLIHSIYIRFEHLSCTEHMLGITGLGVDKADTGLVPMGLPF